MKRWLFLVAGVGLLCVLPVLATLAEADNGRASTSIYNPEEVLRPASRSH
ncbi:hypothetical protein [Pseudooceanicola aestuarii]|nr:hypothetical protein [Pseudooceanicola aestuarii]